MGEKHTKQNQREEVWGGVGGISLLSGQSWKEN